MFKHKNTHTLNKIAYKRYCRHILYRQILSTLTDTLNKGTLGSCSQLFGYICQHIPIWNNCFSSTNLMSFSVIWCMCWHQKSMSYSLTFTVFRKTTGGNWIAVLCHVMPATKPFLLFQFVVLPPADPLDGPWDPDGQNHYNLQWYLVLWGNPVGDFLPRFSSWLWR